MEIKNARWFYGTADTGCASEVSFNPKGRAVLLHSWSPIAAITTGPLSLFTERGESAAVGGEEGWGRGMEGGGRVGEKKRVITQTTIFTHFTPSGSVSQGKKKGKRLFGVYNRPSLHHKVHRLTSVRTPLSLSLTLCSLP